MTIGWFGSDVLDAVTGAVSDVWETIPGSEIVGGAFEDVWTGPLRDFAKTPLGVTVLTAAASAVYGPLAYALGGPYGLANFGAQLATVTWALPGLARGEDFATAWVSEVKRRAEKTAEYVGGEAASHLVAELGVATDFLKGLAPEQIEALQNMPEALLSDAVQEMAADAGVADWSIAMAMNALFDEMPGPPDWAGLFAFDDVTGALLFAGASHTRGIYGDLAAKYYGQQFATAADERAAMRGAGLFDYYPPETDTPAFGSSAPSEASAARKKQGDVLLGVVIVAAIGTVLWWKRKVIAHAASST